MFVFRCIVSGLFALWGASFIFYGTVRESLLLWFVAAVVLPYEAANKAVCGFAAFCGVIGVIKFFNSDTFSAVMGVAIAVIIGIKAIRNHMENERLGLGGYSGGYSSYSGGYSSYSGGYSSGSTTDDYEKRQRRQREDEEERRRQLNEERFEEERRRQEAYEAENRRREAENLSQRKYGCNANTASQWDKDIHNRL